MQYSIKTYEITRVNPRCKGRLSFETISGMLVYNTEGGRRVHRYRCDTCGRDGEAERPRQECNRPVKESGT